jgi:hypothetical protein
MKDINYFRTQALELNQQQFELAFADVIEVYDTNETTLTTEDGVTIIIRWYPSGVYQSEFVVQEPITYLMSQSSYIESQVRDIIKTLKYLTYNGQSVDGETMQYIIEKVGMKDQMLRQLVMSASMDDVFCLVEEKNML